MPQFKKGQSGNPSGKKPGTLNKRAKLAKLFEPHAERLINKTVELALDGDVNALKLCLDRLIPKITSQPVQFDISELDGKSIKNLSVIGEHILKSVNDGVLTLDDAQKFFVILDKQRHLIEFTDLMSKVNEIEELIKN